MNRPAEIRDFKNAIIDHDILRLEISMDYIVTLKHFQSTENLIDEIRGDWLREAHIWLLFHLIKERLSTGKLKYKVDICIIPEIPVHFKDILMV